MYLLIGLGKKVFLADALAALADPVFTQAAQGPLTSGQAWTAAWRFRCRSISTFPAIPIWRSYCADAGLYVAL